MVKAATNLDYFNILECNEISQEFIFERPKPFINLNLSNGNVPNVDLERYFNSGPLNIFTFRDSYILGSQHFLKDDYFFSRYSKTCEPTLASFLKGYYMCPNRNLPLIKSDSCIQANETVLSDCVHLDGCYLYLTPDEVSNYGMWLLIVLPGVDFYLKNKKKYKGVICTVVHEWQKKYLKFLGLSDDEVVVHDVCRVYKVESFDVFVRPSRDLVLSEFERESFGNLSKQYSQSFDFDKVFISRLSLTQNGAYRGLIEEQLLIDELKKLGFLVFEPEKMNFQEQITLFNNSRYVVGLGGAGMFNSVFSKPNQKIVTLESTDIFIQAHSNLFASNALEYGVVFGEVNINDSRPSQKSWSIDVERLISTIESLDL
jgi:hypothetical protein